jgi:hypothetical protein
VRALLPIFWPRVLSTEGRRDDWGEGVRADAIDGRGEESVDIVKEELQHASILRNGTLVVETWLDLENLISPRGCFVERSRCGLCFGRFNCKSLIAVH